MIVRLHGRKAYIEVDYNGVLGSAAAVSGHYQDGDGEALTNDELDIINEKYRKEIEEETLRDEGYYWRY